MTPLVWGLVWFQVFVALIAMPAAYVWLWKKQTKDHLSSLRAGRVCGYGIAHKWKPEFVGPFMEFRWTCERCSETTPTRKGFYLP